MLRTGPGLAKAKRRGGSAEERLVVLGRRVEMWRIRPSWVARLLEEADIVSEGDTSEEPQGLVYYGSTSLRCPLEAVRAGIDGTDEEISAERLAHALLASPHARLLAVRIARREAVTRAAAPLNVMRADVSGRILGGDGSVALALDVDVSAELARVQGLVQPV